MKPSQRLVKIGQESGIFRASLFKHSEFLLESSSVLDQYGASDVVALKVSGIKLMQVIFLDVG